MTTQVAFLGSHATSAYGRHFRPIRDFRPRIERMKWDFSTETLGVILWTIAVLIASAVLIAVAVQQCTRNEDAKDVLGLDSVGLVWVLDGQSQSHETHLRRFIRGSF
jgi:hypothetical protein